MKNIALCFDRAHGMGGPGGTTNATAAADLLSSCDEQVVWTPAAASGRYRFPVRRSGDRDATRAAIAQAYEFLVAEWSPGDRLFLLGAGRGAACARALAHLLGTVGVLRDDIPGWNAEDLRQYVLSAHVLPRTHRDETDWEHIGRLAARLSGRFTVAVDVHFLGLWDTVALSRAGAAPLAGNVHATRHAVAIDGSGQRFGAQLLAGSGTAVEEVWFRGAHCDVAGGHNACPALAGIALDWVLDGAVRAGALVRECPPRSVPTAVDALAGSTHTVSLRRLPAEANVHASVESYLRAHPSYWRRLPARVTWADTDWAARAERLVPGPVTPPSVTEIPALAVPELLPG
ncbi:DUF2235 domain-containing protein [Mycolicibacterium sp. BiH015]|uniref:phospholipase effector Tle1 domain-containing protein n=1 Tax=Mycolicibacterium sp. BiH015 TaxID=3018808 RepID=UPI0022E7E65E|nr:DUF2235 domain-containing protein [Mycolicibacterium sp. BiH015]MDA2892032.1 DUF2235 domain-containing protein [Mycolicibacterium sp. BiH015]